MEIDTNRPVGRVVKEIKKFIEDSVDDKRMSSVLDTASEIENVMGPPPTLKRKKRALDAEAVESDGSSSAKGAATPTEKTIWRLRQNKFTITVNQRKWVDLWQWGSGGTVYHFIPPYNTLEFYTCTGYGTEHDDEVSILNAARPIYDLDLNTPGMPPDYRTTTDFHGWRPLHSAWKISNMVPYTATPGATPSERISGNDCPYFCVGIDSTGNIPFVNLGSAGFINKKNVVDSKRILWNEGNLVANVPDLLDETVLVGKDGSFTYEHNWDNLENYCYAKPLAYLYEKTSSFGHPYTQWGMSPRDMYYLPQALRATLDTVNTMRGRNQFTLSASLLNDPEAEFPTYNFKRQTRMPFIMAYIPNFGGSTFQVNASVLLETSLTFEILLGQNNMAINNKMSTLLQNNVTAPYPPGRQQYFDHRIPLRDQVSTYTPGQSQFEPGNAPQMVHYSFSQHRNL